jgi:hypothetical protein
MFALKYVSNQQWIDKNSSASPHFRRIFWYLKYIIKSQRHDSLPNLIQNSKHETKISQSLMKQSAFTGFEAEVKGLRFEI